MRKGDLVQTGDGYYGIIVGERIVFLGNGCEEVMDEEAWSKLQVLPINIKVLGPRVPECLATSNFLDLIEGRAPCQTICQTTPDFVIGGFPSNTKRA